MIKKGDQTRTKILESARKIFSEKGYSVATMKDFCEETGLSRGGLYRHFSSTKEIMIAMLDSDVTNTKFELEKVISSERSAKQLLTLFLDIQIKEIKKGEGNLELAVYQFCKGENDQEHYIYNRFNTSVEIFEKLIKYGQKRKEFIDCDANETAKRFIFILEGLRISSSIINFPDELVEKQIQGILEMVIRA